MQKPKGIIMQVSGPHAIVMTSDRQFVRVPLQAGMIIGQEIEVSSGKPHPAFAWRKLAMVAASFALALGLWQASAILRPAQVSAYVALDINPSLELSIDEHKDVLQVTPLNEDAEQLLTKLNLKGKPVAKAINAVALEAAKQGFIKPDGDILVTASDAGTTEINLSDLEKELMTSVETSLKQSGIAGHVGGVLVTQKDREAAQALGLSPGKYALYRQAQASDIEISVDDLKKQSVTNLTIQHGQDVKEIVAGMDGGKKLDELVSELSKKQSSASAAKDGDSNGKDSSKGSNGHDGNNGQNGEKNWKNSNDNNSHGQKDRDNEEHKKDKDKDDDSTSSISPTVPANLNSKIRNFFN